MRSLRFGFVAALFAAVSFAPSAQAQSSPIVQHYRAYVAALDRGDLATATSEGQAALAASEQRDGDGGRTAVLALNLANAYLMAGRYAEARPLAQRAVALAQTGAQGVDITLAGVLVARIDIAIEGGSRAGRDAAAQLNALLNGAGAQALTDADIYVGAGQLGNWALANDDFELAQSAWSLAGAHAEGSPFGADFGLGRARTSEGIAIIIGELQNSRRIGEDEGFAAHALLSEAVRALYPLSQRESPTLELTLAQQTYAEARAWMTAVEIKLDADGRRVPETPDVAQGDADGLSEVGPVDLSRPRCMMRLISNPLPSYPDGYQVAAVVLFFRVGPDGQIVSHQIAARAGSDRFADAVERVVDRWRFERTSELGVNCRMESNVFQTVRFVMP